MPSFLQIHQSTDVCHYRNVSPVSLVPRIDIINMKEQHKAGQLLNYNLIYMHQNVFLINASSNKDTL